MGQGILCQYSFMLIQRWMERKTSDGRDVFYSEKEKADTLTGYRHIQIFKAQASPTKKEDIFKFSLFPQSADFL